MYETNLKYYRASITGVIVMDLSVTPNVPKLDKDGKFIVEFLRKTNPPADLVERSGGTLKSNPWLQVELLEDPTLGQGERAPDVIGRDGKAVNVGPVARKGFPINFFWRTHREVINAINNEINPADGSAGRYTWVITPNQAIELQVNPIIRLTNWVLPGKVVNFSTGFDYARMTRNKISHKFGQLLGQTYTDEGGQGEKKIWANTGRLFLFGEEVNSEDVFVKAAIAALAPFKRPEGETNIDVAASIHTAAEGHEDNPDEPPTMVASGPAAMPGGGGAHPVRDKAPN